MRQSLHSPRSFLSALRALIVPAALVAIGTSAQSVIINEVSNGLAGDQ